MTDTSDYGPKPTDQGVRGYRALSDTDIAAINAIKDFEAALAVLWGSVERQPDSDQRWLAIARTHFQEGVSALVRSIAQPEDPFAKMLATNQLDEVEGVIPPRHPDAYRESR